ncbi:hypothetical protein ACUTR3_27460 [Bacillus sp. NA_145.1]|uniref:hypothetical protein n=1 Tax=Bacillus sp. NA_145.1 TaxID=3415652 RepID=UPI0040466B91
MNGHVLYTREDFKNMSGEEMENDITLTLVLYGGLCVCKKCGEFEAGLDKPCNPKKE